MTGKKKIYIAGPLFSAGERAFNEKVALALAPYAEVFLPQRDGLVLADVIQAGIELDEAAAAVFECDINAVTACDVLLIVLDGRAVDEGAVFELGLAYAQKKICVGLQTDPRRLFAFGNNPMLTGALQRIVSDMDELVAWAKDWSGEAA